MSVAAPPPADDAGWVRVHPASPWVRGWTALAVFAFIAGREVVEDYVVRLFGGRPEGAAGPAGPVEPLRVLAGVGVFVGVLLLISLGFFFSWWFTRFRVGEDRIELRQGWLFRSRRQMRYDRIQAVDLQHPFLARLLGLATVKVEAADGGESALELSYLRRAEAEAVRREILDRASGVLSGPAGAATPAEPLAPSDAEADAGELMLQVPVGRLVGSVLLSGSVLGVLTASLVWLGGLAVAAALLPGAVLDEDETLAGIALAGALPMLFSVAGVAWSRLNSGWGFQVRRSADGLRLRHGLTETTQQTVPPGRVQGVTVSQPLFWRLFGWYRVNVAVAGYGEESGRGRDVALPVGPWEDVLRVLTVVAPDPGLDGDPRAAAGLTPAGLMHLGLHGSGTEGGFQHVPRRGRWWFHWATWRRTGFTTTRALLVVRSGWLNRRLQTVQHERVQAAELAQGPVQRRLRLADVRVWVAGAKAVVRDLDEDVALDLYAREARHAAVSRRLADRDRWMRPEERARFDQRTREVAATEAGRRELARAGVGSGDVDGAGGGAAPAARTEEER